ncbi:MAG: class I SAM-dependent methyltransferase [Oscillospiraceae bacterium]|jgi:SAM-dependent methyltransferase|nr:class I SAM-dependent methyltransferase [Oscillospiraceae bacterium]
MKLDRIDNGNAFDWGRTSDDYAKFRDIYPDAFYQKIVDLGLCTEGQTVLDLGTGTGVLPRNLYKYGAKFTGADISENQIEQARRLSGGMDIEYIVASAEDVSFPGKTFDTVTACQSFMYFDKAAVLPKIHAMLKDGGHFVILFMAWLPEESGIAKRSEELVLKHNPAWTGDGMKRYTLPGTPRWAEELYEEDNIVTFSIDIPFTRETWHGRMKACRGIGASSMTEAQIAAWEREHTEYLETQPEQFTIPHFATILSMRKR